MEEETVTIITNLDRICRTCLSEKSESDLQYIFENELESMLLRFANVKVKCCFDFDAQILFINVFLYRQM